MVSFNRTTSRHRKSVRGTRFYKTRAKIDNRPNWLDLPEGIVELIINKLHFVDQIHALAVCKKWRACKDYVRTSERLPWVMSHNRISTGVEDHSFVCELFDPYTRKVYKVSSSVDFCMISTLASKNGLLFADEDKVLWHNPFTNEIKLLPCEIDGATLLTMSTSPTSPDCEIFTIENFCEEQELIINSYHLSKNIVGLKEFVVNMPKFESIMSILYMKGSIYCVMRTGNLYRFVVEDKSWELLTSEYPGSYKPFRLLRDVWLMEINENLMMVAMYIESKKCDWKIFRFDWVEMCWVAETGMKGCAIFISGELAFSGPLTDQNGKELEECRVFYHNEDVYVPGDRGFECFSLSKAGRTRRISSKEYGWIERSNGYDMCFIQPPYFGI